MNREPADSRHVGEHFMEFAIDFLIWQRTATTSRTRYGRIPLLSRS